MGLQAIIKGSVKAGFKAAGDLSQTVTLTGSILDKKTPATGVITTTPETQNVRALVTAYDLNEIANSGGKVLGTDRKIILQASDVTIDIEKLRSVSIGTDQYTVMLPVSSPVQGSVYKIQIRQG
jgi:hypothetical protein